MQCHSNSEWNISDFVLTFLQLDLKAWIWIGLNDRDRKGVYKWSDGTDFNYANWKPGEPSNWYSGKKVRFILK